MRDAERRSVVGTILPDLPPLPGVTLHHPLELLSPDELATVRAALAELVRVQRQALRDTADVRLP